MKGEYGCVLIDTNLEINIKYICPFWGQEDISAETFIDKVTENHFQGIEINLPETGMFRKVFIKKIEALRAKNTEFIFIPQQLVATGNEKISEYIKRVEKNLYELAAYQPTFINSHTGRDYFTFVDNCKVIEACMKVSHKTGVKILHETHRGRFSFHAASLIPYLEKFPELELTGDLSHFCVVSESLLSDQEPMLDKIFPRVSYIHARVGYEQAPQVNDPFAPEWKNHLQRFTGWWDQIVTGRWKKREKEMFICPEFGPAPYMPCLPYTQAPLANQWLINVKMKNYLIAHFKKLVT